MEIIGWIGSICFALCAVPQAWMSYKQKHSKGISWGLLLLWLIGEIFTIIYIWPKMILPLLFNYIINILFLLVIIYYKVKGE